VRILTDDLCIQKALRIRYSLPKIHWLIGTISLASLLYISSEEIWNMFDNEPFPEINLLGFLVYMTFFMILLFFVHYNDTKKIVRRKSIVIITSIISIVVDLCLISLGELVVLNTIQVLPQDISKGVMILLIGAIPSSLGAVVLTSLTAETLKKHTKSLLKETQALRKESEELEELRNHTKELLKSFREQMNEFEKSFEKKSNTEED
jgi:FtsZ-binding cell division protein ZapB